MILGAGACSIAFVGCQKSRDGDGAGSEGRAAQGGNGSEGGADEGGTANRPAENAVIFRIQLAF